MEPPNLETCALNPNHSQESLGFGALEPPRPEVMGAGRRVVVCTLVSARCAPAVPHLICVCVFFGVPRFVGIVTCAWVTCVSSGTVFVFKGSPRSREAGAGRERLAAPGALAVTAAVRCGMAAPANTEAKLLRNSLENVTFTGR